jgi:uncharacterized protein YndB with AHSA1/START domain
MPNSAYLIITDISGYTAFLTQAELEHAQDIMEGLFKALLDSIKPPLLISKPEGDALFCYAPDGSFLQGQTLLEALENSYFAFRIARERMKLNTTCTCRACTLIPSLDLKFVVHYGTYMFQQIANINELQGPDVILVHRLLKNNIKEATGCQAYAFFSDAAATRLPLDQMAGSMMRHSEEYEHVGKVSGYVHDLHVMFDRERDRRRMFPPPEDTWFENSIDIAAPPALVWDFLTEPDRRHAWMGVDRIVIEKRQEGRVGVGSGMHCEHGTTTSLFNVIDWRPFEYVVFDNSPLDGLWLHNSMKLTPIGTGTRVTYIMGKGRATQLKARGIGLMMALTFRKKLEQGIIASMKMLRDMVEVHLTDEGLERGPSGSPAAHQGVPQT